MGKKHGGRQRLENKAALHFLGVLLYILNFSEEEKIPSVGCLPVSPLTFLLRDRPLKIWLHKRKQMLRK